MSEWTTYRLGDISEKIGSGATPRGGKEAYLEFGEISLIRSQNVLDFSFSKNGLAYISEEQAHDLRNVIVEEDDVLLNITGDSVARVCQVPLEILPARVNQHVAIIRGKKEILNQSFLKYYLLEPSFKRYMLGLASAGATRNALTKVMIENFEIKAPEIDDQKEIASILSSLDDKIELNLQMNQTLEAMAQAIFKEWFVNFNFPGFDGELVGGLPKGWRFGNFEDLTDIKTGKGLKREEFSPIGNFSVIGANGELGRTDKFLFEDKFLLTGRVGTLGSIKISYGKKWYSDNVLLMRPKNHFYYTYQILKKIDMQSLNRGSTQPLITQTDLRNHIAIIPEKEVVDFYERTVFELYEKIFFNEGQIQTLTQIRDSLLPKLMTGKIEIQA